jgi:hypothetical protein
MNTPQRVLVRVAGLTGLWIGYLVASPYLWPETPDANIGVGLVGFGLLVLVATGWALVDGSRLYAGAAVLTWVFGAVGFGAVESIRFSVLEHARGVPMGPADLVSGLVFFAVLVAVPAVAAAAIGASIGPQPRHLSARHLSD